MDTNNHPLGNANGFASVNPLIEVNTLDSAARLSVISFFVAGRYCVQNVPPVIVIKGNELFIHFQERGGTNTISFVDKRFKGSFLTHSTGTKQLALVE